MWWYYMVHVIVHLTFFSTLCFWDLFLMINIAQIYLFFYWINIPFYKYSAMCFCILLLGSLFASSFALSVVNSAEVNLRLIVCSCARVRILYTVCTCKCNSWAIGCEAAKNFLISGRSKPWIVVPERKTKIFQIIGSFLLRIRVWFC